MVSKHSRGLEVLTSHAWATKLVEGLAAQGGIRRAPAGLLFELRFAFELTIYCQATVPEYEFQAGIGDSSIDFRVPWLGNDWRIELVSLDESETVQEIRSETHRNVAPGISYDTVLLKSDASDAYRTPSAELIRVAEKLEGKVWDSSSKAAHKFPPRTSGVLNALVISMAGFEGSGDPDLHHCREVAFGSRAVPEWARSPHPKTGKPFLGLFDPTNNRPGARRLRECIDMLGFVAEHSGYEQDDEIGRNIFLIPNPELANAGLVFEFPVRALPERRAPLGNSRADRGGV